MFVVVFAVVTPSCCVLCSFFLIKLDGDQKAAFTHLETTRLIYLCALPFQNGYHRKIVHVMRLFCKINVTRVGLLTCFFLATILDHIFGVSFCFRNMFGEDFMPYTHTYVCVCVFYREKSKRMKVEEGRWESEVRWGGTWKTYTLMQCNRNHTRDTKKYTQKYTIQ